METNLREIIEAGVSEEDAESPSEIRAYAYGRCLGILEGLVIYIPNARDFIELLLGETVEVSQ